MKTLKQEDVITIDSGVDGPRVCIIGGVHGNEICGVKAIEEIVSKGLLRLKKGCVTFIYANRKAIDQNVRFTEKNLNRCFKKDIIGNSYEENLAKDIKKILKSCDVSLDLHAASSKTTRPFIICEKNGFNYIKTIQIKTVCSGFDNLGGGGTDSYMNKIGKIGLCVECGYLADSKTKDKAVEVIFSFLSNLEMVDYQINDFTKEYLRIEYMYKCKNKFILTKEFENFENIKKDELIGYDGDKEIRVNKDGFILFAKSRKKDDIVKESFMFGMKEDS
jgi:succinylglutamate desuccinylase